MKLWNIWYLLFFSNPSFYYFPEILSLWDWTLTNKQVTTRPGYHWQQIDKGRLELCNKAPHRTWRHSHRQGTIFVSEVASCLLATLPYFCFSCIRCTMYIIPVPLLQIMDHIIIFDMFDFRHDPEKNRSLKRLKAYQTLLQIKIKLENRFCSVLRWSNLWLGLLDGD